MICFNDVECSKIGFRFSKQSPLTTYNSITTNIASYASKTLYPHIASVQTQKYIRKPMKYTLLVEHK